MGSPPRLGLYSSFNINQFSHLNTSEVHIIFKNRSKLWKVKFVWNLQRGSGVDQIMAKQADFAEILKQLYSTKVGYCVIYHLLFGLCIIRIIICSVSELMDY